LRRLGDETIGMRDDKEKDTKATWLTSLQITIEEMFMPSQISSSR